MHILFLTDNFPPEVNAPASRTFEHCKEWVRAGHVVSVITCAPNFPKGRVFEGYQNKLWQKETIEGIRVIRVWSFITANEGFVRRTLDYMSYMISAMFTAAFVHKSDLVVGTSPQFFTVCAAYVVSRYKRVPFVFELRDLWPESIKAVGAMRDSVVLRFFEWLELYLYRKAARIVVVTHAFKNNLVERGVSRDKIHVVTNGVDVSRFQPLPKHAELVRRYGLEGKFVAGYIGTHGMAHALETILEAAHRIQESDDYDDYRFILLGDGAKKENLIMKAKGMALRNVIFIESVAKEDVANYWSMLDVSIIHLKKNPLFTTVIPSKLFECMGMGIPILHGVQGESAEIVLDNGVGLVFEPENAKELCDKLRILHKDQVLYCQLQGCCLKAVQAYDRAALAKRMLAILEEVVNESELSIAREEHTTKD